MLTDLKEVKITGKWDYPEAFISHNWVIQLNENLPVRHVRKLIVKFEGTKGLHKGKFNIADFSGVCLMLQ